MSNYLNNSKENIKEKYEKIYVYPGERLMEQKWKLNL